MNISTPFDDQDCFDMKPPKSKQSTLMICVKTNSELRQCIVVQVGESRSVGRSDFVDDFIDDKFMSRKHFEIENHGKFAEVRDLQSTNKTWVNNVAFTTARLQSGEIFRAGKTTFLLEWESQESLDPASSPSPFQTLPETPGLPENSDFPLPKNADPYESRYSSPFESIDEDFFVGSFEELDAVDSANLEMDSNGLSQGPIEPISSKEDPKVGTNEATSIDIESQPLGSEPKEYRLFSAIQHSSGLLEIYSPTSNDSWI